MFGGSQCVQIKIHVDSDLDLFAHSRSERIFAVMVEMLTLPRYTGDYSRYGPSQTERQGVRIPRAYEEANAHG